MSKILIVEDEGVLALDIKQKLLKNDYEVTGIVHYGEDVIPSVKNNKPDIILMDISLAGEIDGIQASEKVQSEYNIPVIFLTAFADTKTLERAKITGPYGYIIKPFDIKELLTNISISLYRKKSEEEITELRKNKDKLFSIIAHDLRSSLSGFMNLSGMLLREFDQLTINEMHEMSEALYKSSSQLYKLLENLLEWSRIQRGLSTINFSKFNLKNAIQDSSRLIQPIAEEKNIELQNNMPDDLQIIADKGMLDIIIRNFISNAIKFSKHDDSIIIDAKPQNNSMVQISIADNGIGIPQDMKDKIFDLHFKKQREGTNNEKGTGIGLNLCKELVEKNNGNIWVESEENKGTTFFFTLQTKYMSGQTSDQFKETANNS